MRQANSSVALVEAQRAAERGKDPVMTILPRHERERGLRRLIPALFAAGALCLPGSHVRAAEPLSLLEAVALARENSPEIGRSAALSAAAAQARREARLTQLPTFEIAETAVRTDSPADVFGLQLMQERFSFPAFTSTDPNDPEALDNFTTEFRASLPLFTGGKIRSGIRQASRMAEAAADMEAHTRYAVELSVTEAYLGVLLSARFVELSERARETTARHVDQAQAFFDTGAIVESDLLQARVQMARMEEDVIRARNQAALARAGLNRAMGVAQDRKFVLVDAAPPADSAAADLSSALSRALDERRDLAAVREQADAAGSAVGQARADYWPQIGLAARYVLNDDRIFGGNGDSYTLAAQAQWNVWNWGRTQARVSRSRSEHKAAEEAARSYSQQVEFEVRRAWQNVGEARARHTVSLQGVRAAERALTILEDRFSQGVARVTDVLDAETLAHESRIREAQAMTDLQVAIRSLYFAAGQSPIPEVQS